MKKEDEPRGRPGHHYWSSPTNPFLGGSKSPGQALIGQGAGARQGGSRGGEEGEGWEELFRIYQVKLSGSGPKCQKVVRKRSGFSIKALNLNSQILNSDNIICTAS